MLVLGVRVAFDTPPQFDSPIGYHTGYEYLHVEIDVDTTNMLKGTTSVALHMQVLLPALLTRWLIYSVGRPHYCTELLAKKESSVAN